MSSLSVSSEPRIRVHDVSVTYRTSLESAPTLKNTVLKLGRREKVVREVDPRGRPYYWIGAGPPEWAEDTASDIAAVHAGFASVTPLHLDLTHHGALGRMAEWEGALNAVLKKKRKR